MNRPIATYIISKNLIEACDKIPVVKKRALVTYSLLHSLGLLHKLKVILSAKASKEDLRLFHSEDYVQYLQTTDDESETDEEEEDAFGLGFDCPSLQDMWTIVLEIAGSSLCAAAALVSGDSNIALNWCGGWHHAQRDTASGFCYVNDVVLCVQKLRQKYDKILYIDLDVHHGDGVENAFLFSPKVMTFSLHQHEPGFFPGTGRVSDVGLGKGKYYSVNAPYKIGINDQQISYLLSRILKEVKEAYPFDAVVCQCGADLLSGDPLGGANVSLDGYVNCVKQVLDLDKPTLFLGGGGYNNVNAAKLWSALTLTVLKEPIPEEIPEHYFFPSYGPDFTFTVTSSLRKSENSMEYLDEMINIIKDNLQKLKINSTSLTPR